MRLYVYSATSFQADFLDVRNSVTSTSMNALLIAFKYRLVSGA